MIQVKNLTKSYEDVKALKGVSFEIPDGEIFGMLGPNGAGKSTTINILSTILEPDSGEVFLNGLELKNNINTCKKIIGVVPQEISLYEDLSAIDNLMFWGSLYKLGKSELKEKSNTVLQLLGLHERKNDKIKTYSGGMKRRINIATALLHSPKILFMDEPTVGIDSQSRNLIFDVIEELNKGGTTIIYTTHYMEEAERLCNRIAIIDMGKIIAQGTLQELKKISNAEEFISIKLDDNVNTDEEKLKKIISSKYSLNDKILNIYSEDIRIELPQLITVLHNSGIEPVQIEIQKANLEQIFLKLVGKQLRD